MVNINEEIKKMECERVEKEWGFAVCDGGYLV